MPLNPADTLNDDPHRILRPPGRGGLGFVSLARDLEPAWPPWQLPAAQGRRPGLAGFAVHTGSTPRK